MTNSSTPLRFFVLIVFFMCTVACNRSPQRAIVGKWQQVDGTRTIEFFPDGTVVIGDTASSNAGTYSFPDSHHLKMVAAKDIIVFDMSLSSKTLVLTPPTQLGQQISFKRVN